MAQFDSPTEAALARFKSEDLSSSPVDGVVGRVVNLGGIILEAIGFKGASAGIGFLSALKNLAANKDEVNLIYFAEALLDDIRRLYRLNEELRQQYDERLKSSEFHVAVANATLHITRTNVESRLKRLARLIANGVKENDLEPEGLDDMMRAAVELREIDLRILGKIFEAQSGLLMTHRRLSSEWAQQVAFGWVDRFGFLDLEEWRASRSALARLESVGFIQRVTTNVAATGELRTQPFGLLPDGAKFYGRVLELAKKAGAR